MPNLTKKQKTLLSELVNLIRNGDIEEEFIVCITHDGGDIIGLDKTPPLITSGALEALAREDLLLLRHPHSGEYHVTILQEAYDQVNSGFQKNNVSLEHVSFSGSNVVLGNNLGNMTLNQTNPELELAFKALADAVSHASEIYQDQLQQTFTWIQEEDKKGEKADETKMTRWIKFIIATAPDIAEVAVATFVNPLLGAGTVLRKVSERAKQELAG